ncbi:MAG: type II toxin-antitoxin system VapC family toxin [Amylibacter sp.]|nr:type II toxin-antitoxin system VapC family toxin [Amylibacter sp.]
MKFLLDTNAIIGVLKGNEGLIAKLKQYQPVDFGMSLIVFHELSFGAYNSQRVDQNLQVVESLQFDVLEFSKSDAQAAGKIRAALKKQGTLIGPYDVLIAGQAVARSLILVTNNMKEFKRVQGLNIEDWLS